MGSVCAPEPAAPSVPFSSIFRIALCTACRKREWGQCLGSHLEALDGRKLTRGCEMECVHAC